MSSAEEGAALLQRATSEGFQAFSKFLSWLEREGPGPALRLPQLTSPGRTALRLGITGPPGAGKSTLVSGVITELRKLQLKVGVLAVDPSSPFTRGAILGDRIRYAEHTLDQNVFIRSLGTRGSLGGLSGAAFLMARAFDAAAFDVLLIETVGVGQTELDILHVADVTCVTLVPESGDSIQAMKAGLMEIADVFVVNKSDRPGADGLAREIENARADYGPVRLHKCVATTGAGVPELTKDLLSTLAQPRLRARPERLRQEAKALRRMAWESAIDRELVAIQDVDSFVASFRGV